ncbi:hypothetical protein SmJEL517_g01972 [Synchytrium microbalum]|uniref:RNA 2-O ribose methyltransferase substrate binding domain-containing protein n=1 Tax=Synchytrium microbalum TaxID=1806994 RepID=A0A507C2J5_9FUNG|nr:uncharacterized protein SmJEL517_g01972 [Synchytrium microbalum]TPX35730.1 hypothetical protein SmJEL517_g01972 [Synchytrium microbalum]
MGRDYLYSHASVQNCLISENRTVYRLHVRDTKDAKPYAEHLRRRRVEVKECSVNELNKLSGDRPHQGVVLEVSQFHTAAIKSLGFVMQDSEWYIEGIVSKKDVFRILLADQSRGLSPVCLCLDQVVDPQNMGAILRSAYFFGVDCIVLTERDTAPLSSVVSRASGGALEMMTIHSTSGLGSFLRQSKENGWHVYGTDLSSSKTHISVKASDTRLVNDRPKILVLGSEGDTNSTAQTNSDVSTSAFVTTLVVSLVTAAVFYAGYIVASRFKSNDEFYYPNKKLGITPMDALENPEKTRNWDGASTIYVTLFTIVALLGAIILIPIYSRGSAPNVSGLVTLTIANLDLDSKAIWAAWVFSTIFSALVVFAAFVLMNISEELFSKIMASKHLAYRTVLCVRIPKGFKQSTVTEIFKILSPQYTAIAMVVNNLETVSKVEKLRNAIEHTATNMIVGVKDKKSGEYEELKKRPEKRLWLDGFKKVDALTYDSKKLLKEMRPEKEPSPITAATLLFETSLAASIAEGVALRANIFKRYRFVNVQEDIIWSNLKISNYTIMIRRLASQSVTAVLILLWGILAVFIASIANIPTLTKLLPFLSPILNASPVIKGLLTGLLPPLVVSIVFSLIPTILGALLTIEGHSLKSRIQIRVNVRYFVFIVVNILLVTSIGSSVFSSLNTIVNNPPSVISSLSTSIPTVSTFFVNFVLLGAFGEPSGYLLDIFGLIIGKVMPLFSSKTAREVEEASKPEPFQPSVFFANHALVAVIGITYMCIAPLVSVFVALYFGIYTIVHCFKFVYVFAAPPPATEIGHKLMNILANQLFVGLYIHQIVMIGLFSLRGQVGVALLVLEVIVLVNTALAHSSLKKLFPLPHANPLPRIRGSGNSVTSTAIASESPTLHSPEASSPEITSSPEKSPAISDEELKQAVDAERRIQNWLAQPDIDSCIWIPVGGGERGEAVKNELEKAGLEVKTENAYIEDGKVKIREEEEERV